MQVIKSSFVAVTRDIFVKTSTKSNCPKFSLVATYIWDIIQEVSYSNYGLDFVRITKAF